MFLYKTYSEYSFISSSVVYKMHHFLRVKQKAILTLYFIESSLSNCENFSFNSFSSTHGVIPSISSGSDVSKSPNPLNVFNSSWVIVGILVKEGSVQNIYK